MDPLSGVLALMRPQSYMSGGLDAGGDWSIHWGQDDLTRCFALISGQCWLLMDGVADPVFLAEGDCVLLPHGQPFRLASDLKLPPVDAHTFFSELPNGRILLRNGGGDFLGLTAFFTFAGDHLSMLLEILPPIVHIRKEPDRAAMRWSLERMMKELRDPQPGGFLLGQHLAQMMLVEALRLYMKEAPTGGVGWLFALSDQKMKAAITCMHDAPANVWTVQALAERVGMSRSSFALRFKETVGTTPMEYLARWRMMLAADRLNNTGDSVIDIALSLGYESQSAFSKSFRKHIGWSPRDYSRSGSPALAHRKRRITLTLGT